jgi:hypothetical protein
MTFNYDFYKTETHRWYVDIPSYPGNIDELEMVCGADTMLDILAQGEKRINLSFSDKYIENAIKLVKIKDTPDIGGAEYFFKSYMDIDYDINLWLCGVTEWVFGYLPDTIYVI